MSLAEARPAERRGPLLGTCSWNYDSWVGLVYSKKAKTAADYLEEYATRYSTAEVDSWFYKLPSRREALDYAGRVGKDFRFTVKVAEDISLTHRRPPRAKDAAAAPRGAASRGAAASEPNPDFLSPELFKRYLDAIEPVLPACDAVMLEFEYLNKAKMGGLSEFIDRLDAFAAGVPAGIPLFFECRNANYLTEDWFAFLESRGIGHVFSEKLYLPPVAELYARFAPRIRGTSVIRLLGGDRAEMERRTGNSWDRIVEERPEKPAIAEMSRKILYAGGKLVINVNNHYEGSAPRTIEWFEAALASGVGSVGAGGEGAGEAGTGIPRGGAGSR